MLLANAGTAPSIESEVQAAKSALASVERDEAGFAVSQPFITEDQFTWFTFRMGMDSDYAATLACAADPQIVSTWFTDPEFLAFYETILENKREAIKYLIPHLNGKALRKIHEMLDSDKPQLLRAGINFTLRIQGLLIDKVQRIDPSKMEQLLESLRIEKPVTIMDAEYKDVS